MGTTALIEKMKNEHKVDWEDYPPGFKYGTFVKKEAFEIECIDHKTKEKVMAKRSRIVSKAFKLSGFNEENISLIFAKYWNEA